MKNTRRMKRLAHMNRRQVTSLSLTSLMDIFTILLLYLLVNQSAGTVLEPPKNIKLPQSIVETKPRETLVVMVSNDDVLVQGERVATMAEVMASPDDVIEAIRDRMIQVRESAVGLATQSEGQDAEVTVMANQKVHFRAMKRVMTSCTAAGFTKISLAVNQK
ncbi:MAG: polymerase subunit sigma-70 [Moraxellaceae bacterium]|jgi:biopolymer transport protein ExbD|nr:polymerase subunit sigma-70 [Moraxellaceae bacterium]